MAITSERGKLIFRKMEKDLRRISSDLNPESVHGFRTTTRRLQTLLDDLLPERSRNQKKLLKVLNRIRKRAGKVRDIDAQLAALRSLKTSQEPRRKTQLTHSLIELRAKHDKRLSKLLKKEAIRDIHKRLEKAASEFKQDKIHDPLVTAKRMMEALPVAGSTPDEDIVLHYRRGVKRARYAAEFAVPSRESAEFILHLRKIQDTLGHWNDWNLLAHTASGAFGEVNQSSLVAALQNVTRGKFRQAIAMLPKAPQPTLPKVESVGLAKAMSAVA